MIGWLNYGDKKGYVIGFFVLFLKNMNFFSVVVIELDRVIFYFWLFSIFVLYFKGNKILIIC